MKAEYLNPFVEAALNTLRQFIPEIEIERGELSISDMPFQSVGTATYIGISGDLEGRVIYEMNRITAVNLASEMNDEDIPGLNELVRSTIQELGNIISGNATTKLRNVANKKTISITPPSMIVGSDTEISDNVSRKFLKVPLKTNMGDIYINLAVRESPGSNYE